YFPETLWALGRVGGIGWVEYVVKPGFRLGIAAILTKVHGDGEWNVIEELPVVNGIGAALIIEIEVINWEAFVFQRRVVGLRGEKCDGSGARQLRIQFR